MRRRKHLNFAAAVVLPLLVVGGCERKHDGGGGHGHSHAEADDHARASTGPAVSNRIDLPEKVRQNLGITFAKVEQRRVAATLRVPGRFELLPSARREYRTVLPARVELLVGQYDRVEPGQLLARLDSPEWRRVQHEAVEAEGEIKVAEANVDVAEAARVENERAVALLRQRTAALSEANAPRADLNAELALAEGKSARLAAEVRAARVKLEEAREHYQSKLRTLGSVVGLPADRLTEPAPATRPAVARTAADAPTTRAGDGEPFWRTIDAIEIRATGAGIVETLGVTNGGWGDAASLVLSVVDPARLRFRATALQADLGRVRDGAAAAIVPPRGVAGDPIPGRVAMGLEANPDARTMELVVAPERAAPWARAGVSAFAEIVTDDSGSPEPAIPLAAVVQDELAKVFFRRDPKDPDKVIRVEGDFGVSDGRWVVVNSGVKAGDEVVLDGVYELKLTGSGKAGGGDGHFHADGTWHPAGTPEKK